MPRCRRRAAAVAVLGALATVLAGCSSADPGSRTPAISTAAKSSTPNIVFVLTDDLSSNLVRYMPHVQAMQRTGTTMSNYYVVDSLCCPSRAAIFTGRYPHDDGVTTNTGPLGGYSGFQNHGDQMHTFATSLDHAGYRTGFMGKYLNGYFPYDPVPPGWDRWDGAGRAYKEFHYALNDQGTIHLYGYRPKAYLTDVLARKASSFITSSAAGGRPFALEVATFAPHSPYTPAPRDARDFPDLNAPRTRAYDRSPRNASRWLASIPPLTPRNESHISEVFRRRVQAVQAVDDMIGRIETTLRRAGVAGNTYVVFSSDNGYHLGEYRLRPGKQTAFDTDVRVPLVVTGPGVPAGATARQMASNIDLASTFARIGGARVPPGADGVSLLPLWRGLHPRPWQRAILVEHVNKQFWLSDPDRQGIRSGDPPTYEAVRTRHALFVRYADGEHDYFNLRRDPLELDNRYRSAPRRVLAPLRRTLTALARCHGTASCQAAARMR